MRCYLLAILLLLVPFGVSAQAPAVSSGTRSAADAAKIPNPAGKVELVEGSATVHDPAEKSRTVKVGEMVYEGESIVTGGDGEMHVSMEDGGFIAVRPNTRMRIVAYQAQGQTDDKGVFSLMQGAFRSITGWIGKYNPKSYQVRTPTATIGVRGTDHEPLVIPQGSKEGEPGTYDKVNVGGTFIQTRHGRVDVAPNQAAFAPWRGKPVPRLLSQVPQFYKPTRNEHLLQARHDAVQKVIDQRRDERRKVSEERRKSLEKRTDARGKAMAERGRSRQAERQKQRQERGKQSQERREKQHPDRGVHSRDEHQKKLQLAEERRKARKLTEGDRLPRGHPQRASERGRDHGLRGGGRGRD